MYQATAIKLQQERDELEKIVQEAKKRMDEALPPTPETEIEYLKSIRDKKRYEEERQMRLQREALEKNFPPFATKTTAEHRVNAYIPDEIGNKYFINIYYIIYFFLIIIIIKIHHVLALESSLIIHYYF